jgi:uncharacterized membrane protein
MLAYMRLMESVDRPGGPAPKAGCAARALRLLRSPRLWLLLIVAGSALGYATFALFRHWHFQSGAYDLGILDQALWHYSRLERPVNTIGDYSNILGDHFHPILLLLAPLYWLVPRPETLLVAQAILLAVSALPVHSFIRRRHPAPVALVLTAAYVSHWAMQKTAARDFHELAFAPLLVALVVWAIDRERFRVFWCAAVALLFVKEDLAPFVAFLGLFLLVRRRVWHGVAALIVGLGFFALVVGWVMPALSGGNGYRYASSFAQLGGIQGIAVLALTKPWRLLTLLVSPAPKLRLMLLWLGPFAFLPLFSPYGLLLLPIAATRLLSATELHWFADFHYSAPLAPILAMAAGDGLARVAARVLEEPVRRRTVLALAILTLGLCSLLPSKLPFWRLLSPRWYALTASDRTGREALRVIPADASVAAQDAIVPHLSRRARIYPLRAGVIATDYVIASRSLNCWPYAGWGEIAVLLEEKRRAGYAPVFERGDWIVLARPDAARPSGPERAVGR